MKQRHCVICRDWYDAKLKACPACGLEKPKYNEWLRVAKMNRELYKQVERAKSEQRYDRAA